MYVCFSALLWFSKSHILLELNWFRGYYLCAIVNCLWERAHAHAFLKWDSDESLQLLKAASITSTIRWCSQPLKLWKLDISHLRFDQGWQKWTSVKCLSSKILSNMKLRQTFFLCPILVLIDLSLGHIRSWSVGLCHFKWLVSKWW